MSGGFAGLAPCVHCGFCLQSCPTYLATGDEADGPRGRIVLMQALERGDLAADDPGLTHHLDRCLGCRGCEPVCPSGVAYGPGLEEARRRIALRRPVAWPIRWVLAVMAQPALRRLMLGLARLVRPMARMFAGPGRIGFAFGMLAATRPAAVRRYGGTAVWRHGGTAVRNSSGRAPSRRTAIFEGCVQRELFSHVNGAAARTLALNGYEVVAAPGQGCCGALHAHAGLHDEAARLARVNVDAFAAVPETAVAVTAAGCGAMLRSYGTLLADDPLAADAQVFAGRVRDVTELLAAAGPRVPGPLPLRVAYDAPCHLLHAQGVEKEPRQVLEAIPGVELVSHEEAALCCGGAGIYTLVQPALSQAVLARKVAALRAAAPDVVVTGNPGCAMQLGAGFLAAGEPVPVLHPVELLDRAYVTVGPGATDTLHSKP